MGLGVNVFFLAANKNEDEELIDWFKNEIKIVNKTLKKNNLDEINEPNDVPDDGRIISDSFPYSWLHYLRRAVVYVQNKKKLTPAPKNYNPSNDDIVEEEQYMMSCHILCHSDCDGYYAPVDFDEIILMEDNDMILGSSVQLLRELKQVAPHLNIQLSEDGELTDVEEEKLLDAKDEFSKEKTVFAILYQAARQSCLHKTLLVFN